MSRDLGEVIYRMKMLGFNAIRLPFTFAALAQVNAMPCPVLIFLAAVILAPYNPCISPYKNTKAYVGVHQCFSGGAVSA